MIFVLINSICFYTFDYISEVFSFIQGYFIFLFVFLFTIFFERILVGKEFYIQLPTGNIAFIAIAFYIPIPLIYGNKLLMALSLWNDNEIILRSLMYTNLGLHCVLLGYNIIKLFKFNLIKTNVYIKKIKIFPLFILYFFAILALISTGNYGITEQLSEESRGYVTILTSLAQFGIFGLIFLVYYYPESKKLIFLVTSIFFLFGLLSGMKESAIMPIVVVAVTYYFKTRVVSKKLIVFGIVLFSITFSIVTSFRNAYLSNGRKELSSIKDLTSTYVKSASDGADKKYNYYKLSSSEMLFSRLNYSTAFGKIITHTEKNGFFMPYDSHPIHILASPFYAILPRFLVFFKPSSNFGKYVTSEIYGYKSGKYSIGISQTGYAYLWNGITGIIILMTFVGMFQALFYKLLYTNYTPIYIFLFLINIYVGDAIWSYTVPFFRFTLIMLIIYYLLGTKLKIRSL